MSVDKLKVVAVIPAAGLGERCRQKLPKQFSMVCFQPLIYHTIEAFLRIDWIDRIILVYPSLFQSEVENIVSQVTYKNQNFSQKLVCVVGGSSRHHSIANGINVIEKTNSNPDIVVIHDGARPLVDEVLLQKIVSAAAKYGAAGPTCKLTSTVVCVDGDGFLDHALERDKLRASEMPQAFRFELVKLAYQKCSQEDYECNTECLDLTQKYTSSKIKLIEANAENLWKVTYNKDLYLADGKLKEKQNVLFQICSNKKAKMSGLLYDKIKLKLEDNFNMVSFSNTTNEKTIFRIQLTLCFCLSWNELEKYLIRSFSDTTIYIGVCVTENKLLANCYSEFLNWSKHNQITSRFYVIHSNLEDLKRSGKILERIVETTIFLAKHAPLELSGQTFFF